MAAEDNVVGEYGVDLFIERHRQAYSRGREECGAVGVCLVEVYCNFEGVSYDFAGGLIVDGGQGVEIAPIPVLPVRWGAEPLARGCDVGEFNPLRFVRNPFEVQRVSSYRTHDQSTYSRVELESFGLPRFPWVGRIAGSRRTRCDIVK